VAIGAQKLLDECKLMRVNTVFAARREKSRMSPERAEAPNWDTFRNRTEKAPGGLSELVSKR
jgi:hypothetical protein